MKSKAAETGRKQGVSHVCMQKSSLGKRGVIVEIPLRKMAFQQCSDAALRVGVLVNVTGLPLANCSV